RHFPGRLCVFPRRRNGFDDRTAAVVVGAEGDQVGQRPDIQLVVRGLDPEHQQQQARGLVGINAGILQQLMHGDVENARGVVGAFDVAPDPIERLGVASQHQRTTRCCCWDCCCCCCWDCCWDCCCCWACCCGCSSCGLPTCCGCCCDCFCDGAVPSDD